MNLQELSASEKILLAEELWDSVTANEQLFPLTSHQKTVIENRLANFSAEPDSGDSWEIVKNRISHS